ncbi:MAG TPA: AAA family ATPase [Streptosporangiaceae bacterium]|jgi:chloramphenicol 3-O-phosphotransferase
MIVWLNGAFGAGKTSTAGELAGMLAGVRQFDPEWVGYMLKANLADHEFTDFQQLPPWRTLVPVVMDEVCRLTGQHLIAVQSVLVENYWRHLRAGLDSRGLPVFHVLLEADPAVLAERIRADEVERGACQWRLDHLSEFAAARSWMETAADLVVDSTALSVAEVAKTVAAAVQPVLDRD